MTETMCKPGDIIKLGDTEFVVLDDDFDDTGNLFILSLDVQEESTFGDSDNYAESRLFCATWEWYSKFLARVCADCPLDQFRYDTRHH